MNIVKTIGVDNQDLFAYNPGTVYSTEMFQYAKHSGELPLSAHIRQRMVALINMVLQGQAWSLISLDFWEWTEGPDYLHWRDNCSALFPILV